MFRALGVVLAGAVAAAVSVGCTTSCDSGAARERDSGGDEADFARARGLLAASVAMPPRPEVLALAQRASDSAQREGAGVRASELHGVASRLYERVFRREGLEQDGKECVLLARAASRDLRVPGACDHGLAAARIAGELAHDPAVTYAETFRVERRARALVAEPVAGAAPVGPTPASACLLEARRTLAGLAPFRPASSVLDAIELGLAAEGAVPRAAGPLAAATTVRAQPSGAPRVARIEQWPGRDTARIVVTLDRAARFRAGDEAGPRGAGLRTFVELDGVDLGAEARDVATEGIVTRVRVEPTISGTRLALDLDGHGYRRVFHLPEPFRIVIDVARHPPRGRARGKRVVARVVLDPGHGGIDPGAIGPSGVREKDVTLDVAHRVAPILAKEGIVVLLTRDDDRSVTLEERTARANGFAADLFVSIHCNAAENHAHRGVETYVLDTAKGDIAARVAARENATSAGAAAELGSILATMRLADQSTRSSKLAQLLQLAALASLQPGYADTLDGGVHTAGFYVLVGARMPSVLFETSYISNPVDEQRLASDDFRQRLADAIVNAIRAYGEGR